LGYDDRATLVARLTQVRTDIAKARSVSQYNTPGGLGVQRAKLKDLLDEESMLLRKIERIDAGNTSRNYVRFKATV